MDTPLAQPVPPPPPKKNNSGIFIGILIFILGIFVGLVIDRTTIFSNLRTLYLRPTPTPTLLSTPTPTPDPTADWKTYTDFYGQFSFKYPDSWTEGPTGGYIKTFFSPDQVYGLSVGSSENRTGVTNTKAYDTIKEYLSATFDNLTNTKSIQIGGKIVTQIYPTTNFGNINEIIFFSTDKKLINTIDLTVDKNKPEKFVDNQKLFDQILSTFKFLDQNNQGTPAGGQHVNCPATRPQVCSMLCIQPPPYLCGSNGKSYCSECQACSNSNVSWYVTQDAPCAVQ